jgi:putative membrane protein
MYYDVIKALHILSVISWMVGLLYLPRLFVYHAESEIGTVRTETFKVMERRLFKAIMTPAMIASFIFGIWMIVVNHGLIFETWFHVKIAAVLAMAACHGKFSKMRRLLENDIQPSSSKTYRIWNEVPTILMVIIVFMSVLKPF